MNQGYSYDDITLVPDAISTIEHRSECNTSLAAFGRVFDIPIIAAPMPDVCGGIMAYTLAKNGSLGIIHRFQSTDDQIQDYRVSGLEAACAVGVTDDYLDRVQGLYESGCRIFCLDVANGANRYVGNAIESIHKTLGGILYSDPPKDYYIIAGNVATVSGYRYLANLGVDAVRVGIAGGSVCETRTETGVYVPMVTAIQNCVKERDYMIKCPQPLIIADGGIKTPSDMCKALALGADFVMCGSIFVPTKESSAEVVKYNGDFFKMWRGSSSYSVQQDSNPDKEVLYNEGNETLIPYHKLKTSKVLARFKAGLQSSMSYMNCKTLEEYREGTTFMLTK